jgi:hypothetical protein
MVRFVPYLAEFSILLWCQQASHESQGVTGKEAFDGLLGHIVGIPSFTF